MIVKKIEDNLGADSHCVGRFSYSCRKNGILICEGFAETREEAERKIDAVLSSNYVASRAMLGPMYDWFMSELSKRK